MNKVRVVKKDEQRMRPEVTKRLLVDERRGLLRRVSEIDRVLKRKEYQTA